MNPQTSLTEKEQDSKRRQTEAELFDIQSRKSREQQKYDDLLVELKRLRNEEFRLQSAIRDKETEKSKLAQSIEAMSADMARLKRMLNTLYH